MDAVTNNTPQVIVDSSPSKEAKMDDATPSQKMDAVTNNTPQVIVDSSPSKEAKMDDATPSQKKKVVFKLNLSSDRERKVVMKTASLIPGVNSIAMDRKDNKLTVAGDMDPLTLAIKLRKLVKTDIISLGERDGKERKAFESMMKMVVFKLNLSSDREKNKVMETAAVIPGVTSVSIDMKDKKLTVVGDMDLLTLAIKLRKLVKTDIISIGERDGEERKAFESMMKAVFKLDLNDNQQAKQKIMQAVSNFQGVDSIAMDMKDQKLTVLGDFDPVLAAQNLRKLCYTEIISVILEKKKDEFKKTEKEEVPEYVKAYIAFNPHMRRDRIL